MDVKVVVMFYCNYILGGVIVLLVLIMLIVIIVVLWVFCIDGVVLYWIIDYWN